MQIVRKSSVMNRQWDDYRKDFEYAAGIDFEETCDAVIAIMDSMYLEGSSGSNPEVKIL